MGRKKNFVVVEHQEEEQVKQVKNDQESIKDFEDGEGAQQYKDEGEDPEQGLQGEDQESGQGSSSSSSSKPTEKKRKKGQMTRQDLFEQWKKDMVQEKRILPRMVVQHFRGGQSKTMDVILQSITLIKGDRELLTDTQLSLVHGQKYGLIGRNGTGQSSLMNAIATQDFPDFPDHLQILLVEQEIQGDDMTPLEWVLETDVERSELLQELNAIEQEKDHAQIDADRIVEINQQLTDISSHDAQNRALTILAGLGFSKEQIYNPTRSLSGGWRMRVTLARALFVQPDILLLDEPTNHLDLQAVMWLEEYLNDCEQTVVVVSHAREFLNNVCTKIIHLLDNKLVYYDGNYESFEKKRNEDLKNQKKQYEQQQDQIEQSQKFIDQFRANAQRASMVQCRIKMLDKMELVEEIVQEEKTIFYFPRIEKIKPPCLKLDQATFGYDESKIILDKCNFYMDCDSRIAIVGSNGAGQSTFLQMLLGQNPPLEGNQYRNPRLRISTFTQHHVDQLDLHVTPIEQLKRLFPGDPVERYRAHLGKFGLKGKLQLTPIFRLSGGQKSRVSFAIAVYNGPHILILDEPTNHLDLDAVDALINALNDYNGGVLIVSHDEHLIQSVCQDIFYIQNGQFKKYNGDFQDYRFDLSAGQL